MTDLSTFEPRRILVCQQRQLGDVLLTTPVLHLLKQRFPQAEIHLFTEAKCEPLLRHDPNISRFHLVDKKLGFFGQLAFYRQVAAHGFDMVLNLQNLPRCRMMTLFSRAPVRLSMKTGTWRDWFYTHAVAEQKGYAAMSKVSLLKDFGIVWNGEAPRIFFTPEEEAEAAHILAECGLREGEKLVTIDATHRRPLKRWPLPNFAELIGMMARHDPSFRFMLLRGPGEDSDVEALRQLCPVPERVFFPEHLPDIRLSAACIKKAVIHIGNGSAPQHMAVSVDTPSLIIPGPEGPWWTYPGPMHGEVVPDLPCHPCRRRECADWSCMKLVSPQMVFERALALLEQR